MLKQQDQVSRSKYEQIKLVLRPKDVEHEIQLRE